MKDMMIIVEVKNQCVNWTNTLCEAIQMTLKNLVSKKIILNPFKKYQ